MILTIQDLIERFEIQGAYKVIVYDDKTDKQMVVAEGYEIRFSQMEDKYLDAEITYMYADDNVLVIEIKKD